jgi:DNA-directed RNA polymerase specialized sigma24 family protein
LLGKFLNNSLLFLKDLTVFAVIFIWEKNLSKSVRNYINKPINMKPIDLAKLFAKLKEGDRDAAAFFYTCYRPFTESFLRRYTRDAHSAHILADDAFFLVMRDIGDVENIDHFLRLLYYTAWRLFKGDGGPDDGSGLPIDAELVEKYRSEVYAYLLFLPPRKQQVFTMRFIEGLSINVIAIALAIKPKTVRNHISEGLIILRTNFPGQQDQIDLLFQ